MSNARSRPASDRIWREVADIKRMNLLHCVSWRERNDANGSTTAAPVTDWRGS